MIMDDLNWHEVHENLTAVQRLLEDETLPATQEALLQRRAEQFSKLSAVEATQQDTLSVLTFQIAAEQYAIPVKDIRTVAQLRRITPVPCVPTFYLGVTNINGLIISVIDLGLFFNFDASGTAKDHTHAIVVNGSNLEIGIAVDDVLTVTEIPHAEIRAVTQDDMQHVHGITANGLIVMDANLLLGDPRLRIYEEPR